MKTIKIIDLLNKKATNEIMPNKIKYSLNELDFQIIVYDEEAGEYVYEKCPNEIWTPSWHHINDEVEILDEFYVNVPIVSRMIIQPGCITVDSPKNTILPQIGELYKYKTVDSVECYEDILKVYDGGEYEIDESLSFVIDKINEIVRRINNIQVKDE